MDFIIKRYNLSNLRFQFKYNASNIPDYSPIISYNDEPIIDKIWFDKQTEFTKQFLLETKDLKINFSTLEFPHSFDYHKLLYKRYNESFAVQYWQFLMNDQIELVNIPEKDLQIILDKNYQHIGTLEDVDVKIDDFSNDFIQNIEDVLEKFKKTGAFFKTSEKSVKNDFDLEPVFTVKKVLQFMISSKEMRYFLSRHEIEQFLVFTSWNNDISEDNEFRVIVLDKKINAISQQFWQTRIYLEESEIPKIIESIIKFFNSIEKIFPYNDCVMDVWIDNDLKTHLIECNPGGIWACSGSALFHWTEDKEVFLQKHDNIYFRYLS